MQMNFNRWCILMLSLRTNISPHSMKMWCLAWKKFFMKRKMQSRKCEKNTKIWGKNYMKSIKRALISSIFEFRLNQCTRINSMCLLVQPLQAYSNKSSLAWMEATWGAPPARCWCRPLQVQFKRDIWVKQHKRKYEMKDCIKYIIKKAIEWMLCVCVCTVANGEWA